jgi:hypothetical protein
MQGAIAECVPLGRTVRTAYPTKLVHQLLPPLWMTWLKQPHKQCVLIPSGFPSTLLNWASGSSKAAFWAFPQALILDCFSGLDVVDAKRPCRLLI